MRVLHINANYILSALHQTMIEHLCSMGIENSVFVGTYDKNRSIIKTREYVSVSECFNKWDKLLFFRKQKKIIDAVEQTYMVNEFDLLHAYTLFTDGNVAYEINKKYGIPYVVAIRNTDVNYFFKHMIHLRNRGLEILKNAKAIFFLSAQYKKQVIEKYVPLGSKDYIEQKSYIIPNGIDDFWHENAYYPDLNLRKREIDKNTIKFIYAGQIDANKNIQTSLKALELLEQEGWNVSLTVIGKVVDKHIFSVIQNHRLLKYLGYMTKDELLKEYRNADIFIMPSHKETFGLVYAEAMSQGLPVLYTEGQGFDGQFEEGKVGYSISDVDASDIVDKIKVVIKNYQSMSRNCTDSIVKFEWNIICNAYVNIYEQICQV